MAIPLFDQKPFAVQERMVGDSFGVRDKCLVVLISIQRPTEGPLATTFVNGSFEEFCQKAITNFFELLVATERSELADVLQFDPNHALACSWITPKRVAFAAIAECWRRRLAIFEQEQRPVESATVRMSISHSIRSAFRLLQMRAIDSLLVEESIWNGLSEAEQMSLSQDGVQPPDWSAFREGINDHLDRVAPTARKVPTSRLEGGALSREVC